VDYPFTPTHLVQSKGGFVRSALSAHDIQFERLAHEGVCRRRYAELGPFCTTAPESQGNSSRRAALRSTAMEARISAGKPSIADHQRAAPPAPKPGNEGPAERGGDGEAQVAVERDDEWVAVIRRLQQRLLDEDPVRAARDLGLDVELDRLRQQGAAGSAEASWGIGRAALSDIGALWAAAASQAWVARRTAWEKHGFVQTRQLTRVKRACRPGMDLRDCWRCDFSEAVEARAHLRDKANTNQHNLLCQAPPAPGNLTPSQGEGAMDTTSENQAATVHHQEATMAVPPRIADAAHLTTILRRNGVLADGRVREVTAEPTRDMMLSRIVRFRLAYEGAADGAPASLILKLPMPRAGGPQGRS
jgi:hypothetical protein